LHGYSPLVWVDIESSPPEVLLRWPLLLACLALPLAPTGALAHGGGLDASGCHTNRKIKDYHCHELEDVARKSKRSSTLEEEINELARLKENGLLSAEEYAAAKRKALGI